MPVAWNRRYRRYGTYQYAEGRPFSARLLDDLASWANMARARAIGPIINQPFFYGLEMGTTYGIAHTGSIETAYVTWPGLHWDLFFSELLVGVRASDPSGVGRVRLYGDLMPYRGTFSAAVRSVALVAPATVGYVYDGVLPLVREPGSGRTYLTMTLQAGSPAATITAYHLYVRGRSPDE